MTITIRDRFTSLRSSPKLGPGTRLGAVAALVLFTLPLVANQHEHGKKQDAQPKVARPDQPTQSKATKRSAISAPPDVALPPPAARTTPSGLAMSVLKRGDGTERPKSNDCLVLRFTGWDRKGAVVATSQSMPQGQVQCLNTAMPGIAEALKAMVAGEKRRVWIPANLTHTEVAHHGTKELQEVDHTMVDLTFDVELVQIMAAPPTPAYLKAPPKDAVRTPTGLAFQVLKSGNGSVHPTMTSQVRLHFSCWNPEGKLLESTMMSGRPATFLVSAAIPAWREGLPKMVVGEKRRLWVPAALGYGEKPVTQRPNLGGNLVYDIELLAVQ